jgi:hypothetical protein
MTSSFYFILEYLVTPLVTGQNEGHQFADSQYAGTAASMCAEAMSGFETARHCCQPLLALATSSIQSDVNTPRLDIRPRSHVHADEARSLELKTAPFECPSCHAEFPQGHVIIDLALAALMHSIELPGPKAGVAVADVTAVYSVDSIIDGRQFNDEQAGYARGHGPVHGVNYVGEPAPRMRKRGASVSRGERVLQSDAYILDKYRRRVLVGLTPEETNEFEILDAQLPFDAKPLSTPPPLPLPPKEQRWLELHEKMAAARENSLARGYGHCLTKVGER